MQKTAQKHCLNQKKGGCYEDKTDDYRIVVGLLIWRSEAGHWLT